MHAGIQYWDPDGSSGFIVEIVWFLRTASSVSSSSCRLCNEPDGLAAPSQLVHGGMPSAGAFYSSSTSSSNSSQFFAANSLHHEGCTSISAGSSGSQVLPGVFTTAPVGDSLAGIAGMRVPGRLTPTVRTGQIANGGMSMRSLKRKSGHIANGGWYDDRLRPPLPRLQYKNTDILPADLAALDRSDTPLCFYRRRRLLRALGGLPQTMVLPPAFSSPAVPPISNSSSRPGPYRGEFSASLWNAQAFFCDDATKFNAKKIYAKSLLDRADMLLLNETHGTDGGNKAWRPPIGTSAWWSAGPTTGRAGIGIIIKDAFLKQFSEAPIWRVIWAGRAAILSLKGAVGSLDILVSYFHTGGEVRDLDKFGVHPSYMEYCNSFPRLREHLRDRISSAIQSKDRVLTLFGGDYNWVPQDIDRRAKSTMLTSGVGIILTSATSRPLLGAGTASSNYINPR